MKPINVCLFFCILVLISCSPKPQAILQQSKARCESIEYGYYEMILAERNPAEGDTVEKLVKCYFKKLPADTLFGGLFHYQQFQSDTIIGGGIYTGKELVTLLPDEQKGEIMQITDWYPEIKDRNPSQSLYMPVLKPEFSSFPSQEDYSDPNVSIQYLGKEKINGTRCYHIQIDSKQEEKGEGAISVGKVIEHFYINKKNYIPVRNSLELTIGLGFLKFIIFSQNTILEFNTEIEPAESLFQLSSIPPDYVRTDYAIDASKLLLPNGTPAPQWTLPTLEKDTLSLESLKGKLVLVDFFFRNCQPCVLSMPLLQELQDEYGPRGLQVVGIDHHDKDAGMLSDFLKSKGISYPMLMAEPEIANAYHVSSYPTLYLINRQGEICYRTSGSSNHLKETLKKIIEANL